MKAEELYRDDTRKILITRHLDEENILHLQLSLSEPKEHAESQVRNFFADITADPSQCELRSANLYIKSNMQHQHYRMQAAQQGRAATAEDTKFFTKTLAQEHKDFQGINEVLPYSTSLSRYDISRNIDELTHPPLFGLSESMKRNLQQSGELLRHELVAEGYIREPSKKPGQSESITF